MTNKPVIAAFDFDETLITRDTLPDFVRHSCSTFAFIGKTIRLIPMLVRFAMGRLDNGRAKEALLTAFLGDMPEVAFTALCQQYSKRLDTLANSVALQRLAWHKSRGDQVIIISASPEDWIRPWASQHVVDKVIATRLERRDGRLTGHLDGPNCHGPEKLTRFLQTYPDRAGYTLYMYGDGKSDAAMFTEADEVFKRRFA